MSRDGDGDGDGDDDNRREHDDEEEEDDDEDDGGNVNEGGGGGGAVKKGENDAAAAARESGGGGGKGRKRKRKRRKKNKKNRDDNDDNDDGDGDGDDGTCNDGEAKRKKTSKDGGKESAAEATTELDRTVYLEGIPFDCTEDDVKGFFSGNGCMDVVQMRLSRWQDTGRLRGYGHVVFGTVDSRTKALEELNGLNLGKRYLSICEPNAPRPGTTAAAVLSSSSSSGALVKPRDQPDGCKTVFVKNLPYDATEEDVLESFRPCGKIIGSVGEGGGKGIRLVRNYVTKQCKGFAYVEFKNPEGAYAAVRKAAKPFGLTVKGRPCFVDYDEGAVKGSYRTADGRLWQKEHGSGRSAGGGGDAGGRRRR